MLTALEGWSCTAPQALASHGAVMVSLSYFKQRDLEWVQRDLEWVQRDLEWVQGDLEWVQRDLEWVHRDGTVRNEPSSHTQPIFT